MYGVEPSARMREVAERGAAHDDVGYLDGTAEAIPLPDGSCELALLYLSFHHFADQERALAELVRVLRPGGVVLLRTQFSDRMPDLHWYRYFPSARRIDATMYRPLGEVLAMASRAGLVGGPEPAGLAAQGSRPLRETYDRLSRRAISTSSTCRRTRSRPASRHSLGTPSCIRTNRSPRSGRICWCCAARPEPDLQAITFRPCHSGVRRSHSVRPAAAADCDGLEVRKFSRTPRRTRVESCAMADVVEQFLADGFIRIDDAFDRETANECLATMWPDTGCDPDDPSTWTEPVVRLNGYGGGPFERAANMPVLHDAFDQLVGPGRWEPRNSLGTIPVRFPHSADPGDDGWHVDGSYTQPGEQWPYCTNLRSRGRALLMLFLFSDVSEDDAPTRIRVGSHLDVPAVLEPAGEEGLSFLDVAAALPERTHERPIAYATGAAGTVYLCHPFLVHAAQPHRGTTPRFMAQPPLYPAEPITLDRADGGYSPVEQAIRAGLTPG